MMQYSKGATRVLIAHYRPDIVSGAELAIADFVNKANDQFKIIMMPPGEGRLSDYYRSRGFEVWPINVQTRRRRYPGLHTVQSFLFARQLKKHNIDILICNTFYAASRVATACQWGKIPYMIYIREYISDYPLFKRRLDEADRILAVSKDVKRFVSTMTDPNKIIVAYDFINTQPIFDRVSSHRSSCVRVLPFEYNVPVVGLIGRITPYKQQDLFVRSIPHILAEVPEAQFAVIGAAKENENDYEESVKKLAQNLGIQDNVIFMGYRDDAVEIMSELTIMCLTSDREPLARVILEAQLVGCPVVVPNSGGCPEMVKDKDTGLLFSSTAPDAEHQLAKQVIRLLKNKEMRKALAVKAKNKTQSSFASGEPIQRIERILASFSRTST